MTTAARPTWSAAKAGTKGYTKEVTSVTKKVSVRDMPSHTQLKYRNSEIEDGTAKVKSKMDLLNDLLSLENESAKGNEAKKSRFDVQHSELENLYKLDQDAKIKDAAANVSHDSDEQNSESEAGSSEDEEEMLLKELARIKQERADAQEKLRIEEEKRSERIRKEQILHGNPLLEDSSDSTSMNPVDSASQSNFEVKRRWNQDVVFMNCAKGDDKTSDKKQEFINDPLRSTFHRRFIDK